ncbi:DUF6074 family protein (plasmid) [Aureimonas ureilytica]|uniref:DUF6074 family protein n=1 Tax=Aureimonas ureilytica TaxID=401562 RepID=UPI003CF60568
MNNHDDLPLFRWKPPQVEVIPFPCRSRIGKIRRTAQLLDENTQKAASAHWKRTTADLERQMERAGISEDRIAAELADFHDAVKVELHRRARQSGRTHRDGGDAA